MVIPLGLVIGQVIADPDRAAERLTIVGGGIAAATALAVLTQIIFGLVLAARRKKVERSTENGAVVIQIRCSEGMNNALVRVFGSRRPDELLRPWQVNLVLVADGRGIEFWNSGEARLQIDWDFIERIEIGVAQELGRRRPGLVVWVVSPSGEQIPLVFRIQRAGVLGLRFEKHSELSETLRAVWNQRPSAGAV